MTTRLLGSTDSSNGRNWRRAVSIQQSRPNLASDPQLRDANRPPPMSGGRVMAPGVGFEPTTCGLTARVRCDHHGHSRPERPFPGRILGPVTAKSTGKPSLGEIRVTDPVTRRKKNRKKEPERITPPQSPTAIHRYPHWTAQRRTAPWPWVPMGPLLNCSLFIHHR